MSETEEKRDHWSSEAYQHSASFVPKLATEVVGWLDPRPEDVILDVGCGDGVLSVDLASILSQGTGKLVGVDASPAMIEAARKLAEEKGFDGDKCRFEVVDATNISASSTPSHPFAPGSFTKIFSNAALHWILRPPSTRKTFFASVHRLLAPEGTFVFECGGRGNVAEVRGVFLSVIGRYVGVEKATEACPWFFPDERWVRGEEGMGHGHGWMIEKCEMQYRPTKTDKGGMEGWVRLMGKGWFDVIDGEEGREEAIRKAVRVLEEVCADPDGRGESWWLGYVRLRVLARKV